MHTPDIKMNLMAETLLKENGMPAGDPFDGSAEPVVYMSENRMPVMIELSSTIMYVIYAAAVLALLIVLPGIRKTKFSTLLGLVTMLTVGISILLALEGTNWLTGSVDLVEAPYGALTSETISGKLEVQIGLSSTNVTLFGHLNDPKIHKHTVPKHATVIKTVDYNEKFHWDKPERMTDEHIDALRKGLPYPILTITEFLSQDADGFNWMRRLRQAGYYSALALYTALASWCLTAIIMCALPIYFPHMMQATGGFMIFSVWTYAFFIHSPKGFALQMGGNMIEFAYGNTYVITFLSGALSMFVGIFLFVIQINNPDKALTVMDMDSYLADQKSVVRPKLIEEKPNQPFSPKTLRRGDSVVIPIADIDEHFKPQVLA